MTVQCRWVPKHWQEEGFRIHRRLVERSRENPWFAVASAVIQSGNVTYSHAQRVVEAVSKAGPQAFLGTAPSDAILSGGAVKHNVSAQQLQDLAGCYMEWCQHGECTRGKTARAAMFSCMFREIGRKPATLFRLYAGDPDAVPVDRHVVRQAMGLGIIKEGDIPWARQDDRDRGIASGKRAQLPVQEAVVAEARKCGVTPAQYMVPLWVRGACHPERSRPDRVHIEGDYYTNCETLRVRDTMKPLEQYSKGRVQVRVRRGAQ